MRRVPQTVAEAVAYIIAEMPLAAQTELRTVDERALTLRERSAWSSTVVDAINRFGLDWPVWKDVQRRLHEQQASREAADPFLARFAARYPDLARPAHHHDDLFHELLVQVWRTVRAR